MQLCNPTLPVHLSRQLPQLRLALYLGRPWQLRRHPCLGHSQLKVSILPVIY